MGAKRITLANKDLEKFLRRECVLRKFIKNTESEGAPFNYETDDLKITQSFIFEKTPEGFHFWQNLHDKFELQQSKIIN